jgi:peptidoglycan/xylan/chitin deacetylase (PgdA/CDA1 family)
MMQVFEALLESSTIVGYPSRVFRRAMKERPSNLLVLLYHDVTKSQFRNHVQFLQKWFEFGCIDDVVNAALHEDFPSNPTVVITFDDGLTSFYRNAFPIVDELNIPVVNYATSGFVGSEFWSNPKTNSMIIYRDSVPSPVSVISGMIPRNSSEAKSMGYSVHRCMSRSELIEVDRHHCVTIGGHSVTHPKLAYLSDDESWNQIVESKEELERIVGHAINHFAYPNGVFSRREMRYVRDAGFISAAAVNDKWIERNFSPYCFLRKGTGPCGSSVSWLKYRIGK